MNKITIVQKKQTETKTKGFVWTNNPDIQKLLDVIASILADEYVQIAKQNPKVFSKNGGSK